MIIDVQKNTFLINFETDNFAEIKLSGINEKIYTVKNNQIIITTEELEMITNKKKAFINISYLSNNQWIPFSIENTKMIFNSRTEITHDEIIYICYIGGDKKLKIYNEGFISNKAILQKVELNKFEKKNDVLCLELTLITKYFQPEIVNLFLKDRKTKKQLIVSSTDIQINSTEIIPNSYSILYKNHVTFFIDKNDIFALINSIYNPDEPFFNWIDFYYNFEIKEYTTSSYAFRLPTNFTKYLDDIFLESIENTTFLLKPFGTDNYYFSLNYYIYETEQLNYFLERSKNNHVKKLKSHKKTTVIIGEYHNTARDNGLVFFKYLVKHYKNDFNIYYAIKKNSSDLKNLTNYMRYVRFIGSPEYTDCFLNANVIVHSHSSYYLCPFSTYEGLESFKEKTCYFIQHGIILQKDVRHLYYFDDHKFLDYFITSSNRESMLIENSYGFPSNYILEFGLPRFDNLFTWQQKLKRINIFSKNKKFFIFFTWRIKLNNLTAKEFVDTDYYQNIMKIINDPFWSKNKQLTLTLKLHPNLEKYIDLFSTKNNNVFISTKNDENSIQNYIINSDVMITDYSSAALDFAITSKPVIYYLGLAENKNEDESYQKYLPGEIIETYDQLISSIKLLADQRKNHTKFEDRLDDIYVQRDNKASYRLAEHIKKHTKRS